MRSGESRDKHCIFGLSTGLQTAVRRAIRHTITSSFTLYPPDGSRQEKSPLFRVR
jgi:hypothetical protein